MKKANYIVGVLGIGLGAYIFAKASTFPANMSATDPGAAYFPKMLAILLIALCLGLIVSTLLKKGEGEKLDFPPQVAHLIIAFAGLFVYCLLLKPLGFILDTLWFVFGMQYLLKSRNWVTMSIVSVATTAIIYVVFRMVLYVNLPNGVLSGIL